MEVQVVYEGRTIGSLPRYGNVKYTETRSAENSKGKVSACFTAEHVAGNNPITNIGSLCVTSNHWSDDVTSRAWVRDIFIPYYKAVCLLLNLTYGMQVAILILDCWWGWLGEFKVWCQQQYPFIKFVYVPPVCTPRGQPMDAGIIAKTKGKGRQLHGRWATQYTLAQLNSGVNPSDIRLPLDAQSIKQTLTTT